MRRANMPVPDMEILEEGYIQGEEETGEGDLAGPPREQGSANSNNGFEFRPDAYSLNMRHLTESYREIPFERQLELGRIIQGFEKRKKKLKAGITFLLKKAELGRLRPKERRKLGCLMAEYQEIENNKGRKAAIDELVNSCLLFVVKIARQYRNHPLLDLIQEGNVGLMEAAIRYKPEFKCHFTTYAEYWIMNYIFATAVEQSTTIKFYEAKLAEIRLYSKVWSVLANQSSERPSPEAVIAGVREKLKSRGRWKKIPDPTPERLELIRKWLVLLEKVNLEDKRGPEGSSTLHNFISYGTDESPIQGTVEAIRESEIAKVEESLIRGLTPIEIMVLRRRFIMEDTLREIGDTFAAGKKVSREYVRQIEERARGKVRAATAGSHEKLLEALR